MLTSKLVLAASLVLATAGAYAEAGDLQINDWPTYNSTVTREQVKAELREATRLGLVSMGEGDVPIATAEQERLIAKAGQEAAQQFAKSDDAES
jgi:hypothetical protein